jgi:ribulose kinase
VLAALRNERWLARYGGRISSEWVLPKALQIADEAPAVYDAAACVLEGGDWVVWQLTGAVIRNACGAGYKGLWHKREGLSQIYVDVFNRDVAVAGAPQASALGAAMLGPWPLEPRAAATTH